MQLSFRKTDLWLFSLWLAAAFAAHALIGWLNPRLQDSWFVLAALSGAALGLGQGLAMTRRSRIGLMWGLATFMAVTAYGWLEGALQLPLQAAQRATQDAGWSLLFAALMQAVYGAAIGTAQWAVLRTETPLPGRWILFSSLAYISPAILGAEVFGRPLTAYRDLPGTGVVALITGLGLVWMFNQAGEIVKIREINEQELV